MSGGILGYLILRGGLGRNQKIRVGRDWKILDWKVQAGLTDGMRPREKKEIDAEDWLVSMDSSLIRGHRDRARRRCHTVLWQSTSIF